MACGIEIDVDDLVAEVIKKLDLTKYVTIDYGTANNLTLHGGLTIDDNVKNYLCSVLGDCMANTTGTAQQDCGCDNHVVAFYIDKENDLLTIKLKHGEIFSISKADLVEWLKIKVTGGQPPAAGTDVFVTSGSLENGSTLRLVKNDGNNVDIDLSTLSDKHLVSGTMINSSTLRLQLNDGQEIDINIPASGGLPPSRIEAGRFVKNGNEYFIELERGDLTTVKFKVPKLPTTGGGTTSPGTDVYIESGSVTGNTLTLVRSDGQNIAIDLSPYVPAFDDRVIKTMSITPDHKLRVEYGTDSTPAMGTLEVDLTPYTTVVTDNTTITGNGSQASPLIATKGVSNVSISGSVLTVLLSDNTKYDVNLPVPVDNNTTNVTLEVVGNELRLTDSDSNTVKTTLPAPTITFTLAADGTKPAVTNETSLPTRMVGKRDLILGEPDRFIEHVIDGQTYLIPAYRKV